LKNTGLTSRATISSLVDWNRSLAFTELLLRASGTHVSFELSNLLRGSGRLWFSGLLKMLRSTLRTSGELRSSLPEAPIVRRGVGLSSMNLRALSGAPVWCDSLRLMFASRSKLPRRAEEGRLLALPVALLALFGAGEKRPLLEVIEGERSDILRPPLALWGVKERRVGTDGRLPVCGEEEGGGLMLSERRAAAPTMGSTNCLALFSWASICCSCCSSTWGSTAGGTGLEEVTFRAVDRPAVAAVAELSAAPGVTSVAAPDGMGEEAVLIGDSVCTSN
jgi:hypothetical protein